MEHKELLKVPWDWQIGRHPLTEDYVFISKSEKCAGKVVQEWVDGADKEEI